MSRARDTNEVELRAIMIVMREMSIMMFIDAKMSTWLKIHGNLEFDKIKDEQDRLRLYASNLLKQPEIDLDNHNLEGEVEASYNLLIKYFKRKVSHTFYYQLENSKEELNDIAYYILMLIEHKTLINTTHFTNLIGHALKEFGLTTIR